MKKRELPQLSPIVREIKIDYSPAIALTVLEPMIDDLYESICDMVDIAINNSGKLDPKLSLIIAEIYSKFNSLKKASAR